MEAQRRGNEAASRDSPFAGSVVSDSKKCGVTRGKGRGDFQVGTCEVTFM